MTIAVCDDESKILEEIASFILKEFPGNKVKLYSSGEAFLAASGAASSASAASSAGAATSRGVGGAVDSPDLLLLDIDMPGISGMEVAAALGEQKARTLIVFVTAHDELVYDSFKYHPFAFVRKKFLEEELRSVLQDCQKEFEGRKRRFIFQSSSQTVTLALSDILYFEGQANYLAIHTVDGLYKMRSTMAAVEEELKDSGFLRIHKGFLINLEHIKILKTEELELDKGQVLPIGKSYSEEAKKSILRFMRR